MTDKSPCEFAMYRVLLATVCGFSWLWACAPTFAIEPLLPWRSSQWRYFDADHANRLPAENWSSVECSDAAWAVGQTIIGYGDADIVTRLPSLQMNQPRSTAVVFRHRLRMAELNRFRLFRGRLICDDGAVVYMNGREVFRRNMPAGEITLQSSAVRAVGPDLAVERETHVFALAAATLQPGDNVVAVSVHQANGTSRDMAFDLELAGLESAEEVAVFERELATQADASDQAEPASLKLKPVAQIRAALRRP